MCASLFSCGKFFGWSAGGNKKNSRRSNLASGGGHLPTVSFARDIDLGEYLVAFENEAAEESVKLINIENCDNYENALKYLKSLDINKVHLESEHILQITINIDENFDDLNYSSISDGLNESCQNFKTISSILTLTSNIDKCTLIHWKSKNIEHFLTFQPYKNASYEDVEKFYNFLVKFLLNSLKKGYLGLGNEVSVDVDTKLIALHFFADYRDFNLMLIAAEQGDLFLVKTLFKLGISTESSINGVNAQLLAYKNHHFDVLLFYLKSNLTFPISIDINDCPDDVKDFVNICNNLHDQIISKNIENILQILTENSDIRYFYNLSNVSAAVVAINTKQLDIYETLLIHEVHFGPHEDIDEIFSKLSENHCEALRELHFQYLKDLPEKHLNILMANSLIAHDVSDEKEKRKLIQGAFKILNSNAIIKVILMVVAASKNFRIIFDFNRDSVQVLDPTADSYTTGLFYDSGRIYIGAKNLTNKTTQNETLAIIAHELCHCAINLCFNNKARPYYSKDQAAKDEFERINNLCQNNRKKEKIIRLVYQCYPEDMYHAELIVRVPHLIALYHKQPDKLQYCQDNFSELFLNFENKVIPEMKNAIPLIENRDKNVIKKKNKIIRNLVIMTVISLIGTLILGLVLYKPHYEFLKLSNDEKLLIKNGFVLYKSVKVKLSDLFHENSLAYENLESKNIEDILDKKILNLSEIHLLYLNNYISHSWMNLSESLRVKLLSSKLIFQNEKIKFEELNEKVENAFNELSSKEIVDILDGKILNVGKMIKNETSFYIERKLIIEDAKRLFGYFNNEKEKNLTRENFEEFMKEILKEEFEKYAKIVDEIDGNLEFDPRRDIYDLNSNQYKFLYKYTNDVLNDVKELNMKMLILSSEAGAGKTITFEQLSILIKRQFPLRWVSYIDLKEFIKFYKISPENENENGKNLLKKILNLNEKNNFEEKVFDELFELGNVVILWNGFDEISPTYNSFILNILKSIYNNSLNIQFVCTRPLHSKQLRDEFKMQTYQLVPLGKDAQKEFLMKFFQSKNISEINEINKNIEGVEKIIQSLELKVRQEKIIRNFNTPLMIKLIAEIYDDKDLFDSGNLYEIYNQFVRKKVHIWLENAKNFANPTIATLLTSSKFSIIEIYQKYAMRFETLLVYYSTTLFKMNKLNIMQKQIPRELPFEEISRMGILFINNETEFEFAHKTFAEFFIAQYFIDNIYNAIDLISIEEAEIRLEYFYLITNEYGYDQRIITDFMMAYLQSNHQQPTTLFNPQISKLLKTKFRHFFMNLLDTNYQQVFEFLFEFFKKDQQVLNVLLQIDHDETFYTAIFNPNYATYFIDPQKIKNILKNSLNSQESFNKIIEGKNQKGKILFGIFYYEKLFNCTKIHETLSIQKISNESENLWTFYEKLYYHENLTKLEQQNLLLAAISPEIYKVYNSSSNLFYYNNLWINIENLFTNNQIADILGFSILRFLQVDLEGSSPEIFLPFLLNKSTKLLTNSQIFDMFLSNNILNMATWNSTDFHIFWNFLNNHTNELEKKKLLLNEGKCFAGYYYETDDKNKFSPWYHTYYYYDHTPCTIFHAILKENNNELIQFIQQIYSNHLNVDEIQEIFMKSSDFLLYAMGGADVQFAANFTFYLNHLFSNNKNKLNEIFTKYIEPTSLSIFPYLNNYSQLKSLQWDLPAMTKIFRDLYEKVN